MEKLPPVPTTWPSGKGKNGDRKIAIASFWGERGRMTRWSTEDFYDIKTTLHNIDSDGCLAKPIGCMTLPRVKSNARDGLEQTWCVTHCWFVGYNKCTLWWRMWSIIKEAVHDCGQGIHVKSLSLSLKIAVRLKVLHKNEAFSKTNFKNALTEDVFREACRLLPPWNPLIKVKLATPHKCSLSARDRELWEKWANDYWANENK